MSTVRAINFQHPSASAANITLASDGTVTGGIPSPNRNLLFNGAMQVAQRGTSTASITTSGYYTADRWVVDIATLGTWTQTVENDAPTGSGFRQSLKMLCTTADASPAAGDVLQVRQGLEGQDLQRIAKGTSSAQALTLSFWVKSNVTGTYTIYLTDNDNSRMASYQYTISSSATWERKTIAIAADTTGAFDNDNAGSLDVAFTLAAGTNFTSGSIQNAWGTNTAANRAVGQTNLAAATNNYWQITGVQLETGSVATGFEFKSFGQELRECQRYYYVAASGNNQQLSMGAYTDSSTVSAALSFPVTMRSAPVLNSVTGANYYRMRSNGVNDDFNSFTIQLAGPANVGLYNNSEVSGTSGYGGIVYLVNAAASVAFSAEL